MWRKINKRIRIMQNKAKRVKDNALHQGAEAVVRGTNQGVMEDVDVEGMTARAATASAPSTAR